LTDSDDRVVSVELFDCASDAEALVSGSEALRKSRAFLAEIWEKSRLVGKWERSAATPLHWQKLAS
jgi:hypothetical protein